MGRRKINSNEIISDERRRQITLSKRKKGLFKKAKELADMTGVKVALVVINGNKTYEYSNYPLQDTLLEHKVKSHQSIQDNQEVNHLWNE